MNADLGEEDPGRVVDGGADVGKDHAPAEQWAEGATVMLARDDLRRFRLGGHAFVKQ